MPSISKKSSTRRTKFYGRRSTPAWSDLTTLVLERIRDLLGSDLYDVRLRSVCSNWRRSLAHPRNPTYNLPHRLPWLPNFAGYPASMAEDTPMLECSRVYQISPADDPSNGWLVRSMDAKPNTLTLLSIFHPSRVTCRPRLRSSLNLLQFRISEVSKCYRIDHACHHKIRKLLFLPHFVQNVDFTLLLVFTSGEMYYWNHGDSVWTPVDVKQYKFEDLILFRGLCYATNCKGLLVSIDSAFRLTEVTPPVEYLVSYSNVIETILVAFESDLLLVSLLSITGIYPDRPHGVNIYRWTSEGWCMRRHLGEDTVLLASEDLSTSICARDFVGCKGNCVYFFECLYNYAYEDVGVKTILCDEYNVYDMDEDRVYTDAMKRRRVKVFWPPPTWMLPPPKSKRLLQQLQTSV